jgi:hypothetical protein
MAKEIVNYRKKYINFAKNFTVISKKFLHITLVILFAVEVFAQNEHELNRQFGFKDFCFDNNIRTVMAYKSGNELSEPYIALNSNETITFMFDDLSEASRDFYYTIKHCNADWEEDNLFVNDYMKGFAENNIYDLKYSVNTTVFYKNYTLTIPNEDVQIVTSGNYLLKVYDRYDNELPVFQKGFKVFENKVALSLKYRPVTGYGSNGKQQLEFSLNKGSLPLQNHSIELKLRVEQNSQRMPSQALPTIAFQTNLNIDYSNATKNIYKAESEYRTFDIRSLAYNAEGVNKIINQSQQYHALLNIDQQNDSEIYQYSRDINGKYFIDSDRINKHTDKNQEADYINVYFTIENPNPQRNRKIYIYGALSDWGLKPECRMEYNESRQAYEATLLLKQGYYNYKYVAVDNNINFLSDFFDGSFVETENSYTVNVYYKGIHDRWDRLVAIESVDTAK